MSLQIFVAHTGAQLVVEPTSLESLEALQQWLARTTAISASDQILLTEKGRHVRLPTLLLENEIFLFDKALFANSANVKVTQTPLPDHYEPDNPPDTLENEKSLKSWENLFKARRDWALDLVKRCTPMATDAAHHIAARSVIDRCVSVATGNKEGFIRKAEGRFHEVKSWFDEVAQEQSENVEHWQDDLDRLETIPARREFAVFFVNHDNGQDNSRRDTLSLASFVNRDILRKAAIRTRSTTEVFDKRIAELGIAVADISARYQELRDGMARSQSQYGTNLAEEPDRLLSEMSAFVRKISNDYEQVAASPQVPKSITQASKLAHNHTKQLLPAITEITSEMSDLVRRTVDLKNAAASDAIDRMQIVASIESSIGAFNKDIQAIVLPQEDQEAFEQLATPSRLPFAYGSLLIEAVRRAEWVEKMKRDSSSLAEELASYQEEEQRRRKKWMKSMSDVLLVDTLDSKALGVEINLLGEEKGWPSITRADLDAYLLALRQAGEFQGVVDSLEQAARDMDKPTRQQLKRIKAFKAGSVHEAGLGRGSLMLRGEDDVRVLREANSRLEEELKGQKSRVRKLESLLHGQGQAGRLSTGSSFVPSVDRFAEASTVEPVTLTASPKQELLDDFKRRPSSASRRLSTPQNADDKTLSRRISILEAQLLAEQVKSAELEQEAHANRDAQRDASRQAEDANSIKRDIMENMEAQQKEFASERRVLEEELAKAKQKTEEIEDELDRVLGSRMNERSEADTKLQSLTSAVSQIKKDTAADMQKAETLIKSLQEELQKRDLAKADLLASLAELWSVLSSETPVPKEPQGAIAELEALAQRCVDQLKDLEHALAMAQSENESLQSAMDEQKAETSSFAGQITNLEAEARKMRQELTSEQAKASSLKVELEEEKKHREQLQSKFTAGETGTEALRRSLVEGENRGIRLAAELADAKSHANGLDVELSITQKKVEALQAGMDSKTECLDQRSARAKELTQRLYSQTERLKRLLEGLGFAITRQDNMMVIQRASKTNASAVLSDPSASLNRSVSAQGLTKTFSEDMKLSVLNWMDKVDVDEEGRKYSEYIETLDQFDVNTFSEAISKRMRDIEHTARKWQKELRSHREKAHKYQSEAHDKISYRSFKPGDLALFLPTRNQVTRPWAAFNVGAPHYFLREQDSHKLQHKEWLVARISKVEERVVDLSKTLGGRGISSDGRSIGDTSEGGVSFEDDNPFDLSDGLRWYLLDAAEEKAGAPGTPGLGRAAAAASARVDAKGSIRIEQSKSNNDAAKNLTRSLDSRRSSTNSKKGIPAVGKASADVSSHEALAGPSHLRTSSNTSSLRPPPNSGSPRLTADDVEENSNGQPSTTKPMSPPGPTSLISNIVPDTQASAASPAKSTRSTSASPTKKNAESNKDGGLWNSLWKFDVNYESGATKRRDK